MRSIAVILLIVSSCSAPKPAVAPTAKPSAACAGVEYRQLDFWLGDWDVAVRARQSPTSDVWGEAKGRQHIEAILGGCVIAEHFTADGPPTPWAGKSYSIWQPQAGKWRQTWVDDQGSYIALSGGIENGVMTLYGEPRTVENTQVQMRMVFLNVTGNALRWEWQRSTDAWKTVTVMMEIGYQRRPRTD